MKERFTLERLSLKKASGLLKLYLLTFTLIAAILTLSACGGVTITLSPGEAKNTSYDYELLFPSEKYPETALHIYGAIEQGHSNVCTIDRTGAEANRKKSLAGIDTKKGYDRDEWPMAMCKEGGEGASVAYVASSDNRGAGSWVGHQLSDYPDGTMVLFVVEKPENLFPDAPASAEEVVYANCAAVREAGKAPLYKGDPGYSSKLDRDGDGVACQ